MFTREVFMRSAHGIAIQMEDVFLLLAYCLLKVKTSMQKIEPPFHYIDAFKKFGEESRNLTTWVQSATSCANYFFQALFFPPTFYAVKPDKIRSEKRKGNFTSRYYFPTREIVVHGS